MFFKRDTVTIVFKLSFKIQNIINSMKHNRKITYHLIVICFQLKESTTKIKIKYIVTPMKFLYTTLCLVSLL